MMHLERATVPVTTKIPLFPYHILNIIRYTPAAANVIFPAENSHGEMIYWISETGLAELLISQVGTDNHDNGQKLISAKEGVRDAKTANLLMESIVRRVKERLNKSHHKHISNKKIFNQVSILGSSMFTNRSNGSDFDVTLCISEQLGQEESMIIYEIIKQIMQNGDFLEQLNEELDSIEAPTKKLIGLDCFIWSMRKDGQWESLKPIYL